MFISAAYISLCPTLNARLLTVNVVIIVTANKRSHCHKSFADQSESMYAYTCVIMHKQVCNDYISLVLPANCSAVM